MKLNLGIVWSVLSLLVLANGSDYDVSIYNTDNGKEIIVSRNEVPILSGRIGVGRNYTIRGGSRTTKITQKDFPFIQDDDDVQLRVDLGMNTVTITWTTKNMKEILRDCYELDTGKAHWYGGPERWQQDWPLEKLKINGTAPYVIKKSDNFAVAERYWLNSKGAFIFVDDKVPLFVDQNLHYKNQVCFVAKSESPYINREEVILKYQVGYKDDPKQAHLLAVNRFLGKPTGYPNEKMIREPTWTTWPKYKTGLQEADIVNYYNSIKARGYKGQIEIDMGWETCYGSHVFRFKNISNIVKDMKANGFRVTLWIHPFVDDTCEDYSTIGKQKGYFVKNPKGDTEAIWWESNKAHQIDFTKPEAAKWFADRIAVLKTDPGIDGFKFDAGETDYAIPPSSYANVDQELVPNILTQKYVETCSTFGDLTEVRSAWRSQSLPVFLRMIDKESTWGSNNGLYTLVTTLLQLNMNGYVMVLPDMIGGNGYGKNLPTAELIVRWTQANTFMPALQFGYLPWEYTNTNFDTEKIVKKYMKLHEDYSDKIIQAMKASIEKGTPVNPPIWWIDPKDLIALGTDDEFLLGEDILVAPVLKLNQRKRTVYLPKGSWKDGNTGTIYKGPITISDYPAGIDILPFFILQK